AFVGAVDVERQGAGIVEFKHFDAVPAQARGALLGAGDGAGDAMPDPRQRIDEEGDGRTGADADDAAVLDVLDGLFAGQALGFGHVRPTRVKEAVSIAPPSPAAPTGANPCGSTRTPRRAHRRGCGSRPAAAAAPGGARSPRRPGPSAAVRAWPSRRSISTCGRTGSCRGRAPTRPRRCRRCRGPRNW